MIHEFNLCSLFLCCTTLSSGAHSSFIAGIFCSSCVQKLEVVMIRIHCDMMCNRRKHVCVGAGGFANQALTARLEG